MSDVTRILAAIDQGDDRSASEQLLPLVYEELRRLAQQRLLREKPGQTLQATALVHEAYLRLVGTDQSWEGRSHFFAAASEAMRRILIESARRKQQPKRGGDLQREVLIDAHLAVEPASDDLIALSEALDKLQTEDGVAAKLVKLRYFIGLTTEQAADVLGLPHRSAYRKWAYARSWLSLEISEGDQPNPRE